jgi:hypothetical protein
MRKALPYSMISGKSRRTKGKKVMELRQIFFSILAQKVKIWLNFTIISFVFLHLLSYI